MDKEQLVEIESRASATWAGNTRRYQTQQKFFEKVLEAFS